jgi:hypothetical protein
MRRARVGSPPIISLSCQEQKNLSLEQSSSLARQVDFGAGRRQVGASHRGRGFRLGAADFCTIYSLVMRRASPSPPPTLLHRQVVGESAPPTSDPVRRSFAHPRAASPAPRTRAQPAHLGAGGRATPMHDPPAHMPAHTSSHCLQKRSFLLISRCGLPQVLPALAAG